MRRIVLIGQGPTAEAALASLAERHEVAAVFRRADGAGDPVARFAAQHAIPLREEISPAGMAQAIAELRPDGAVVSSYDRILGPDLLRLCPFVNVHFSPLPRYRGRANVNWALINGEPEAAITVHGIDAGLDSGNILLQETIPIGPEATIAELYASLNEIQRRELGATVERFLAGDPGRPQTGMPSYCCTRIPGDGEIDWTAPTARIHGLIRALARPYPGAFTFLGLARIPILRATPVADAPHYAGRIPGRVCGVDGANGTVDVLTGDGILRLHEVEGPEGSALPASRLIRSTKCSLGLHPRDLVRRIEQLEQTIARMEERWAYATPESAPGTGNTTLERP